MKKRESLCMSERLGLIGKMRDEGIFSMRMLTASLSKKPLPKAPVINKSPHKEVLEAPTTVADEINKLKQREGRKRQYAILSQRREQLEKEKQERLKREAERLALKAKQGSGSTKKLHSPKRVSTTRLTREEEKKLERLVAFIESHTPSVTARPTSLLFHKLRNRFKQITSKQFMLHKCISEMAPKKELIYPNGIPALTKSGCIICGKSNVKVEYYGERHICLICRKIICTPDNKLVNLCVVGGDIIAYTEENGRYNTNVDINNMKIMGWRCFATFAGDNELIVLLHDKEVDYGNK